MAYTPNVWQDRIVVGGNQFTDQDGKNYTFDPNPTTVVQAGTPFSAAWMNHLESGVAASMPLSGGTFTGNTVAYSTKRSGQCLRNNLVANAAGTPVSTDFIYFVRK